MPVELRVNDKVVVADLVSGKARVAATRADIVVVDPSSKILRVEPQIDAWRATQEPRKARRLRRIDPADPCIAGRAEP